MWDSEWLSDIRTAGRHPEKEVKIRFFWRQRDDIFFITANLSGDIFTAQNADNLFDCEITFFLHINVCKEYLIKYDLNILFLYYDFL